MFSRSFSMLCCSDHGEFDLAVFNSSARKGVSREFLDDWPICEKVHLRLDLCWQLSLQNAALPRVPVRYLKRHRLRSLVNLFFSGVDEFPHVLLLTSKFNSGLDTSTSFVRLY